jgi:16S rRNA (cytidine1402-2'-O)-methyltransferase
VSREPSGSPGTLFVVSTPIGNLGDLSARAREVLGSAPVLACEDTRRTGRLFELVGIKAPRLVALHGHNEAERSSHLVDRLLAGEDVALVSDAGTPLLSDPGERLVAAAVAASVPVVAVPGPSALLAALVVSGLDTARFRFEGFLPRKGAERATRLAEIAAAPHPSICYESPHRVDQTLADLAEACGTKRRVVVARELTKLHEETWRGTLAEALDAVAAGGERRGEHVLVVEGAAPRARPDSVALEDAIARLVEAGLERRDAVSAAVVLLGASRRDAYEASLRVGKAATE